MKGICAAIVICLILPLIGGSTLAQAQSAMPIELSEANRAKIEKFLGKGFLGKALAGDPIADAAMFFLFQPGSWSFQFTSGDAQGRVQEQSLDDIKKKKSGEIGRYRNGKNLVDFLSRSEDGSISVVSEQDTEKGIVSRFSPPEPFYIAGMKPGGSKKFKIDVKVYDLSDPADVTYSGSLDLTYSYIGAYEVTVPAGSYETALIKWDYKGKVGPASIEDTQYRFLAEGVGVVAMVDKKNISAMLVYHDNSKYGKVLMKSN